MLSPGEVLVGSLIAHAFGGIFWIFHAADTYSIRSKRDGARLALLTPVWPVMIVWAAIRGLQTLVIEAEILPPRIGSGAIDQDAGAVSVHEPQLKVLAPPVLGYRPSVSPPAEAIELPRSGSGMVKS